MPSRPSSHAVSRAPCSSGRVSHAMTRTPSWRSASSMQTPSAEPRPPVASAPVLQCVSTVRAPATADQRRTPPAPPLAASSAAWIFCASPRAALAIVDGPAPSAAARTRSTAHARFTAVGREATRISDALLQRAQRRPGRELHRQPVGRRDPDVRRAPHRQPRDRRRGVGRAGQRPATSRRPAAASGPRRPAAVRPTSAPGCQPRHRPYCAPGAQGSLLFGRPVLRTRLAVGLAALLSLLVPAAAQAGDPIMPLASVQSGMHCTGYTRDPRRRHHDASTSTSSTCSRGPDAQILVTVSGPAVDATGIAEGFSGSPVKCVDPADGVAKTIGAIAQGTGDYGNKLVLVTPIQTMLGEQVDPPASAKPMPAALKRKVRALATPLSFSGVSGPVAAALQHGRQEARPRALRGARRAARRRLPGRRRCSPAARSPSACPAATSRPARSAPSPTSTATPSGPSAIRSTRPAAARCCSRTPTSTRWSTTRSTPSEVTSYKLAAPGHDLGTLTNDAPSAVVGRLGALPQRFPLRVVGHATWTPAASVHENVEIADETVAGQPTGSSSLTQVGPVAVAQAAYDILRGSPARQSGEMCVRITIRERKAPLRFCNTYVGGSPSRRPRRWSPTSPPPPASLDAYNFGTLHVTGAAVNLKLRRELRQAYLLAASAPTRVRRGSDVKVRILAQRVRGARFTQDRQGPRPARPQEGHAHPEPHRHGGRRGRRPGRRSGPQLDVHHQLGRRGRLVRGRPGPSRRRASWPRPSPAWRARTA